MPRLSEFYGIAIYMYFRDHAPPYFRDHDPPHFHAIYAGEEALFDISTGEILRGTLPRRAQVLVADWLELHRHELKANWERAQSPEPLEPIEPLR